MKFKKTKSLVLLDPHSEVIPNIPDGAKVDIVLSPSLYWVKKLSLPVKYARDAKKLLPSLFEEILPDGHYSYAVFKEGDEFVAFAYEDKKIIDELSKKGISIADTENIYFAQTELLPLTPCKINDKEVLIADNTIVCLAPIAWAQDAKELSLASLTPSKKTITLQQFSHIIDNSSLNKIGLLLGLFIVVLSVEIFITLQKITTIEQERGKLLSDYKLYPTMMQNRAVLNDYEQTFTRQTRLRDILAILLKLDLKQKITKIDFKNKTLHVKMHGIDQATSKKIIQSLASYKQNLKSTLKDNSFEIEVAL